ncbi:uncharacterized protein C8A04DRAFT_9992 [Dichotomopilus funicola]|uniref:Uncharacterized protein n=1 Tax=Dichotomopilus funicola TaxID=1934379 RepID=A0AAN6V920_9PEZI|nr:hypothetical protein C8A04DRAFT_9992 [Dichotomopilus funicola]
MIPSTRTQPVVPVAGKRDESPPPPEGAVSEEDDLDLDVDQDDAQSFLQPAISPLATRLTSPRTPAADKVAAFERQPGGLFEVVGGDGDEPSPPLRTVPMAEPSPSHVPIPIPTLPTPWQAGPKTFLVPEQGRFRSSMAAAFQTHSRQHRSQSVGESALKRLSKALPSISIPSGLISNITTPTFFSSSSSNSSSSSPQKDGHHGPGSQPLTPAPTSVPTPASILTPLTPIRGLDRSHHTRQSSSPIQPDSARPRTLRHSASDDSLLYHTLSRVSSLGDDERFAHVREQVNVRIKAIKDSFDGPSFKLPQMPNLLNAPLKKSATDPIQRHRAGSLGILQSRPAPADPLDAVLENLTGDIVVMGGYRGSILRSAKAPHRRLWVPVKVQLGVRKVNLEVGLEPEDEEAMEQSIIADGMLQNIGPVDISKRLFKRLRECENAKNGTLRVHDYGYDWRLSPHLLSRKLAEFLEKLPSNQPGVRPEQRGAWVIAHSLGGLITRHAVNQRPELFGGVLYVGVPQRCINILGPLRNGDAVLFNEKILTAQVNFSLRTTFVFLPEDGFAFVDKNTKEEYKIDFYNVDDWIKYRLCPCVSEPALPALSRSSSAFGSLLSLSDSLPSLPLRNRSSTQSKRTSNPAAGLAAEIRESMFKDRTLAPQMNSSSAPFSSSPPNSHPPSPPERSSTPPPPSHQQPQPDDTRARNIAYLRRTLSETKRFRSELAHNPTHQRTNAYPPLALIYAKDIPTTYAAGITSRDAIACADAYDDLLFASGDGVVLAREAMMPQGYEVVRGGRVCTDRGHITMLGDLGAVGKGLGALVRGRGKGIGLGVARGTGKN